MMENGETPDPSSLSSVFISGHYSDSNKVVIEKVEKNIEKSMVCSMNLIIRPTVYNLLALIPV